MDYISQNQFFLKESLARQEIVKDDGSLFPVTLTPLFLTSNEASFLLDNSEKIVSGLEKIIQSYQDRGTVYDYYPEFHGLDDLIMVPSLYGDNIYLARLDYAIKENGEFAVLEFNCANPGGMVLIPAIKELYEQTSYFQETFRQIEIIETPLDRKGFFLDGLLQTCTERGISNPHIGLVYSPHRPIKTDIRFLAQQCRKMDVPCTILQVQKAISKEDGIYSNSQKMDLVHQKFDFHNMTNGSCRPWFYNKDIREISDYLTAYKNKQSLFVNLFSSMLIAESKKNICLLQSSEIQSLLDDSEKKAVSETLSYQTYVLQKCDASLITHFLENKNNYVLKHAYNTRSEGVFIGRSLDNETWARLFNENKKIPSVVQEYIDHRLDEIYEFDRPVKTPFRTSISVYVLKGKACGFLSRSSLDYRSNFYAGGVCRPVYVVK